MFDTKQQFIRQALVGACCLLVALFSPFAGSLSAEETPSQAERDEAKLILIGIIAERNKIRSGVVKISGTRLWRGASLPELKDEEVEGLFAFDFDRDWIRYDNAELQYVRHINASNAPKKLDAKSLNKIPAEVFRRRLCILRNDEYSMSWSQSGPTSCSHIELRPPDTELNTPTTEDHHFCDLRAAGLMDDRSFQKFEPVQSICETLQEKVPLAGFERNRDVVTLTLENDWVRIATEIETNDGFRPRSYVLTPLIGVPYRNECKAVWERRGGVDVPVRMTMQLEKPDQKYLLKYDLKLDWQSVNKPVDPKLFDYRSLPDIPTNLAILVIDSRGEEPVILGKWAGTGKELEPYSLVTLQPLRAPRP